MLALSTRRPFVDLRWPVSWYPRSASALTTQVDDDLAAAWTAAICR
jgi:hypothetical protein